MDIIIEQVINELQLSYKQVTKTLQLLSEGATVPFIARYRKEATGSLDEVMIMKIRDLHNFYTELEKRRNSIIENIKEQGKLTDELHNLLVQAKTLVELEDLYLPYKPKRKTRASIAKEKGLEPLASIMLEQTSIDIEVKAKEFINEDVGINTTEEALAGARDIVAEIINENAALRKILRNLYLTKGLVSSKIAKGKTEEGEKYEQYFEFSESVQKIPSHRLLAILRGENEGFLRVDISPNTEDVLYFIKKKFIKNNSISAKHIELAAKDSYKRLLHPSIENDIRKELKEKADEKAIEVFVSNLQQLLMQAPLGEKRVLAIDPGFRTGCKLVVLNELGQLLHNETIYPHPPLMEVKKSINKIENIVDSFKIEAIAIGNGTAGRETEFFIRKLKFKRDVIAVMVNEAGASVYSASPIARQEFPDYDVTVRGAISIGRRLMDPLAELVKIDPKSIGVGQYQHDVDQAKLQKSLEESVVNCVNKVGVELNTASKELLTYVSGIGNSLATNIVEYRNQNGPFHNRYDIMKVPQFGEKSFEQAAGFLRIKNGNNKLDSTAVHPESYYIVEKILNTLGVEIQELLEDKDKKTKWLNSIKPEHFIDDKVGLPTIIDIFSELDQPGRDPRNKFDFFEFDNTVHAIEDLREGMELPGIINNITAFGAFVDIGIHESGLIHISQLSNKYIKDPNEIVKINQKVLVKVLQVDLKRKRIQLSMKL